MPDALDDSPPACLSAGMSGTGTCPTKTIMNIKKRGGEKMKLLTKELRKQIPALYSQENVKDPMVICKFFDPAGSWTWYAIEGQEEECDHGRDFLFFGFVVGFDAELGYFTLSQLRTAKRGLTGLRALPIERDLYFKSCRLSEVREKHNREHGTQI